MRPALKSLFLTEYKSLYDLWVIPFIIGILISSENFNVPWGILIPTFILLTLFLYQKRGKFLKPFVLLLLMGFLGLACMHLRIEQMDKPVLNTTLYEVEITGKIESVSHLPNYQKITVKNVHFLNHLFESTPEKIRLNYFQNEPSLKTGDTIHFTADIRPPREPVFFGSYNESRTLYFEGIGGIGKINKISSVQSLPVQNKIEEIRTRIGNRVKHALPDEPAKIAIALTIGEQQVINQELYDMFRSAGVIHILSISGFHLSLLAAFVFFLVRGLLSLCPIIIEYISPKKTAALLALITTAGYILISGMHIPAIRSFIMIAFVLSAVLWNRTALSIRSLSVAATLILLYRPESIFNIGFQLSFTAVLILITLYQPFEKRFLKKEKSSIIGKFFKIFLGIALASLFITCATTPLTIYHFNQYAPYGILGNVLTTLILSFWVMPFLFLGLFFMPFGIDTLFLKIAGIGISYVTAVCDIIHHWQNALIRIPAFDTISLCLIMLGIILFCAMKTRLRLIGIFVCLIGIMVSFLTPYPDILIGDKGQTIAVKNQGHLRFLSAMPHSQTAQIWLIKNGEEPVLKNTPTTPPPFIFWKKKKISLTEENCFKADLCLRNPKKTYLIYIDRKIKVRIP